MVEKSTAHLQNIVTKVHALSSELHNQLSNDIKAKSVQRASTINDIINIYSASKQIEDTHEIIKKIHSLKSKIGEYELSWSKTKLTSLQKENVETTWAVASKHITHAISQNTTVLQKNLLHAYELLQHYSPESIDSQLAAGTNEAEICRSWQTNRYIFAELLREPIQACAELQEKSKKTMEFLSS